MGTARPHHQPGSPRCCVPDAPLVSCAHSRTPGREGRGVFSSKGKKKHGEGGRKERPREHRNRDGGGIDEAPRGGGAGEGGGGRGAIGGADVPMRGRWQRRVAARRAGARLLLGHIPVRTSSVFRRRRACVSVILPSRPSSSRFFSPRRVGVQIDLSILSPWDSQCQALQPVDCAHHRHESTAIRSLLKLLLLFCSQPPGGDVTCSCA